MKITCEKSMCIVCMRMKTAVGCLIGTKKAPELNTLEESFS